MHNWSVSWASQAFNCLLPIIDQYVVENQKLFTLNLQFFAINSLWKCKPSKIVCFLLNHKKCNCLSWATIQPKVKEQNDSMQIFGLCEQRKGMWVSYRFLKKIATLESQCGGSISCLDEFSLIEDTRRWLIIGMEGENGMNGGEHTGKR